MVEASERPLKSWIFTLEPGKLLHLIVYDFPRVHVIPAAEGYVTRGAGTVMAKGLFDMSYFDGEEIDMILIL
jgi:hypothetical protein